jgi:hypothetical protein
MATAQDLTKVYTVNGAASGSSTSLPDWLTRKRAAKGGKGKRAIVKERIEGTIDLIQHFEFPEASIKIKTTRDGHHAIATGVYKPQMRCYDLDELTLKFERHSDCENVDFVVRSQRAICEQSHGTISELSNARSFQMTGLKLCSFRRTGQLSCIHRGGCTTVPGYRNSDAHYHIIIHPAML